MGKKPTRGSVVARCRAARAPEPKERLDAAELLNALANMVQPVGE